MNFSAYYKKLESNKRQINPEKDREYNDNLKKNIDEIQQKEVIIKNWIKNLNTNNILSFIDFRTYFNGGNNQYIKDNSLSLFLGFNKYKIINRIEKMALSYSTDEEYSFFIELSKYFSFYIKPNHNKTIGVSSSQIRQVFSKIKKIKNKIEKNKNDDLVSEKKELIKLKLEIHYIIGKNQTNRQLCEFLELVIKLIDKTNSKKEFIYLYEFLEGVICYLKYFGDNK